MPVVWPCDQLVDVPSLTLWLVPDVWLTPCATPSVCDWLQFVPWEWLTLCPWLAVCAVESVCPQVWLSATPWLTPCTRE